MVQPLFFPNIYIRKRVFNALAENFSGISVYDVSGPEYNGYEDFSDHLKPLVPAMGQKDIMAYLLDGINTPHLYSAEASSRLGADLMKTLEAGSAGKPDVSEISEKALRAALYLYMASVYDRQTNEINTGINAVLERKNRLMKEMDGFFGNGSSDGETPEFELESEFRIEQRLESWSQLFITSLENGSPAGDGCYITDIEEIPEIISEYEPEIEYLGDISIVPRAIFCLQEFLLSMTGCDWSLDGPALKKSLVDRNTGEAPFLSLYILPERDPGSVFIRFAQGVNLSKTAFKRNTGVRNTVIALVRI